MDIKDFGKQPLKIQADERKTSTLGFSLVKAVSSSPKKPVKKAFGHFMKCPDEKKRTKEKLPHPFAVFSHKKREQKPSVATGNLAAAPLEAVSFLSTALSTQENAQVSAMSQSQAALFTLAEKLCEKIAVVEKEGIVKISLPLKLASFEGVTLQVTLHSTAPRQYNVEFFGCSLEQQAQLTNAQALNLLHGQVEQAGFQIHQLYAVQDLQETFSAPSSSEKDRDSQEQEHSQKEQESF